MGLVTKESTVGNKGVQLTKQELEYVMLKLRTSMYRGDEFEQFYIVFKKLTEQIRSLEE